MDDFLQQMTAIMVPAAITIAGLLASLLVYYVRSFVNSRVKNAEAKAAMLRIADLVEAAVGELNQVARDQTPDKRRLLVEAYRRVKVQLPPKIQQAAVETVGDFQKFLIMKIEAEVYRQKQNQITATRSAAAAPAGGDGGDGGTGKSV